MSLYVISDPHLSLGVDKPMDIFKGWTDYTGRLVSSWEKLIDNNDTVVLPGDISWGMNLGEALPDFRFLDALPGTKLIGKGNHDYWWCTMKKMQEFLAQNEITTLKFLFNNAFFVDGIAVGGSRGWFFDAAGQDSGENEKVIFREAGRLRTSLTEAQKLGGKTVAFMHYPVAADGNICRPLMDVLHEFDISRCYFGHIHGDRSGRYEDYIVEGIRFSLISCDALSFCPKKVMERVAGSG